MRTLVFILLVFVSFNVCAQKPVFVRVYDLTGKRIYGGHVFNVSDSSLELKINGLQKNIAVSNIGYIKTKRSGAHNVFIGSMIGAGVVAIAGAASAQPDATWFAYSAGDGALVGIILGLPVGAALGALSIPLKNSKTYLVNGDLVKWKVFESEVAKR